MNLFVYDRWLNVGGFSVIAAPNGGILDVRLEYLNYFTAYTSSGFGFLTNDANQIALRSRWRFLPKTALLWEATFTPTFYVNTTGSSTGLFNSYPMSTRFGLNGLLSERVALLAMLGWTATYFQLGDNASTPVGQLEFRYIFGPLTSFRAGFIRDVNPSALGNYYIRNGLYLGINQSFSGRFYVSAELSGGYWQYGFIATPGGMVDSTNYTGADDATGRFHSWRIMGTLFGEYRPTDIIGINATIVGSSNISNVNVNLPVAPGMGAVSESLSWNKLEAYLGVRVNW